MLRRVDQHRLDHFIECLIELGIVHFPMLQEPAVAIYYLHKSGVVSLPDILIQCTGLVLKIVELPLTKNVPIKNSKSKLFGSCYLVALAAPLQQLRKFGVPGDEQI